MSRSLALARHRGRRPLGRGRRRRGRDAGADERHLRRARARPDRRGRERARGARPARLGRSGPRPAPGGRRRRPRSLGQPHRVVVPALGRRALGARLRRAGRPARRARRRSTRWGRRSRQSDGRPLADRLLDALRAGDAAGGDRRGRQSAALRIATPDAGYGGSDNVPLDLRVDDHPEPIDELARLFGLLRAADRADARRDGASRSTPRCSRSCATCSCARGHGAAGGPRAA